MENREHAWPIGGSTAFYWGCPSESADYSHPAMATDFISLAASSTSRNAAARCWLLETPHDLTPPGPFEQCPSSRQPQVPHWGAWVLGGAQANYRTSCLLVLSLYHCSDHLKSHNYCTSMSSVYYITYNFAPGMYFVGLGTDIPHRLTCSSTAPLLHLASHKRTPVPRAQPAPAVPLEHEEGPLHLRGQLPDGRAGGEA